MKKFALVLAAILPLVATAQDDLVKKLENNKSDSANKKYVFTTIKDLENTAVRQPGQLWHLLELFYQLLPGK